MLPRHGSPDQPVDLFHSLDLRLNNTHDFTLLQRETTCGFGTSIL
jgi:hypothetical protein